MVLGAGDFLSRVYIQGEHELPIGLLSGIFPPKERASPFIRRKTACPGSGWTFESSQYVDLNDANGKAHRWVNTSLPTGK